MDDDLFIPVWEGSYAEARERLTWLEEAYIPADLGDGLVAGEARVEVPPGYVEEAKDVMRLGPRPAPSPEFASAPLLAGWKVALAVALVAVLVLAMLL